MLFAATRKELEIMTLSEVRKTNITDITYIRNLQYDTNVLTCKTATDTHTKRTDLRLPKGTRGRMDWDFHVSRCKPLYIDQVKQGLTVQHKELHLITCDNHNGKEYENEYKYIYMY